MIYVYDKNFAIIGDDSGHIFQMTEAIEFDMVVAFLRLGRKYDFRGLHLEAVQRLLHDYSKMLEDFDSMSSG